MVVIEQKMQHRKYLNSTGSIFVDGRLFIVFRITRSLQRREETRDDFLSIKSHEGRLLFSAQLG